MLLERASLLGISTRDECPQLGERSAACCAFNGLNADTLSECAASNHIKDRESGGQAAAHHSSVWGRRFLAATLIAPPDVAECLNTDAMAVLAVIRNEAQSKCSLPVAQIAARANIGRAKVRAAIRLAQISVEQTPGGKRTIVNRGLKSRC
jgi:hypothetical protein